MTPRPFNPMPSVVLFGAMRTSEVAPITSITEYNFTGQPFDTSDGLSYYQARYYDAALNRFIQPDSIIPDFCNPQYLNRYSYVRNNPVRYTDPTGHCVLGDDGKCARDANGKIIGTTLPRGNTPSKKSYDPAESVHTGNALVVSWLLDDPLARNYVFDMDNSFAQDVQYGPLMARARAQWAAAGYPSHIVYTNITIDDRSGGAGSMLQSAAAYIGEQLKLELCEAGVPYLWGKAFGSTPGSDINPTGGILGSYDSVTFDVVSPGKVQITVVNTTNWESGTRIPGTNTSLSIILNQAYPANGPRPGVGANESRQTFQWTESYQSGGSSGFR